MNMEQILLDNPAARLHSILQKVNDDSPSEPDEKGSVHLAEILNVPNKPEKLLPAYAHLISLSQEVHSAVCRYYPAQREYFQPLVTAMANAISATSPYMNTWKQMRPRMLAEDSLNLSSLASDFLSRHISPAPREDLSTERLREQFQDLKHQILDEGSFSDQLKQFLVSQLQEILYGLDHFDLYGAAPIREALYNVTSNIELTKKNKSSVITNIIGFLMVAALQTPSFINDVADMPESIEDLKELIFEEPKLPLTPPVLLKPTLNALPSGLKCYSTEGNIGGGSKDG